METPSVSGGHSSEWDKKEESASSSQGSLKPQGHNFFDADHDMIGIDVPSTCTQLSYYLPITFQQKSWRLCEYLSHNINSVLISSQNTVSYYKLLKLLCYVASIQDEPTFWLILAFKVHKIKTKTHKTHNKIKEDKKY